MERLSKDVFVLKDESFRLAISQRLGLLLCSPCKRRCICTEANIASHRWSFTITFIIYDIINVPSHMLALMQFLNLFTLLMVIVSAPMSGMYPLL